ncbi:MAG: hypothetical protein QNJ16_15585 [Rhodobacter sp.]|nr:hypothetical protein [Rhodobacter sp.]
MTSLFAGRSAIQVSLIVLAVLAAVVAGVVWFNDSLTGIVGIGGIIWGTYHVDRAIVAEESRADGTNNKLLIVLRSAIVLSAVSFATTLFGMLNFVSTSSDGLGDKIVGWFISVGTTFGIQFIMLVISLVLGERLIGMRPRFDDKLHRNLHSFQGAPNKDRAGLVQRGTGFITAMVLLALAAIAFGWISWQDITALFNAFLTGGAGPQIGLGIAFVAAALIALRSSQVLSDFWQPLTLVFLAFVYFGTLAVSSLFSFDSYYGLLQTESDLDQRKGSIIREETDAMIFSARASLEDEVGVLREGDRARQIDQQVAGGIDLLSQNARNLEQEFVRDAARQQQELDDENQRRQEKIDELRKLKTEARNELLSILSDKNQLQVAVTNLETSLENAQAGLQSQIEQRDSVQEEINNNLAWADCEKLGLTDGICAEAPGEMSGKPSCGSRCEGYQKRAADLERVELVDAERGISTATANLRRTEGELEDARTRFQAARDQTTANQGETAAVALRVRESDALYDEQISALQREISFRVVSARSTEFDVGALSSAFANFKSDPSKESLASYIETCRQTRDTLLRIGVEDAEVVGFDCQPASMSILASRADRIRDARTAFEAQCTGTPLTVSPANATTGPAAGESNAPTDIPLALAPPSPANEASADVLRAVGEDNFAGPTNESAAAPRNELPGTEADLPTDSGSPQIVTNSTSTPLQAASPAQTEATAENGAQLTSSGANDDATLRRIVDRTRTCLTLANVGQQAVRSASAQLTELESTYLSESPEIRRAVLDLQRGNVFALGAAAAAVFIDVLILIVGLLVAMSRPSVLYENPLDPGVAAVEESLSRTAAFYAPDRRETTGMRIFYKYLETRYLDGDGDILGGDTSDEIYRATVNMQAVAPEHRPLVTAILNALPARYQKIVDFKSIESGGRGESAKRTAINQGIVAYISRKAHDMDSTSADDLHGFGDPVSLAANRGLRNLGTGSGSAQGGGASARSENRNGSSGGGSLDDDLAKGRPN